MQFVVACKSKGESFASLCRGFGISRKIGYKWSKRSRAGGLKALRDVSRRPHRRGKMHHFWWRERLRRARRARPHWGAKKLRWRRQKAFPHSKRIPAGGTLARWLLECNLVKKRKRRARPGPAVEGSTGGKKLQPSVDGGLSKAGFARAMGGVAPGSPATIENVPTKLWLSKCLGTFIGRALAGCPVSSKRLAIRALGTKGGCTTAGTSNGKDASALSEELLWANR